MELTLPRSKPSLLLALETNGTATAIARIVDQQLLQTAITSAALAKRRQARTAGNEFLARRLRREAEELESLAS